MTFQDAQDLAVEFGALKFKGDRTHPRFACWRDRIAYLPVAAGRGDTSIRNAIAEANRYA